MDWGPARQGKGQHGRVSGGMPALACQGQHMPGHALACQGHSTRGPAARRGGPRELRLSWARSTA